MGKSAVRRGVYAITCDDGRSYVGGTLNIRKRWGDHHQTLRVGRHRNRLLQQAWDLLGESAFTFTVLEEVPEGADLLAAEQRHIDRLKAVETGFNLAPKAGSSSGVVRSDETRRRISEWRRAHYADPSSRARESEAQKGRHGRERCSQAKLSTSDVVEIRQLASCGVFQKDIAARFGVARSTVGSVLLRARPDRAADGSAS